MKIEGYEVEEVAPGVKVYTRRDDTKINYLAETPWIHIHYPMSDEVADNAGYTEVEFCCHGCGTALWVTLDFPLPENAGKHIRDEFVENHTDCKGYAYLDDQKHKLPDPGDIVGFKHLCPDFRAHIYATDYRKNFRKTQR